MSDDRTLPIIVVPCYNEEHRLEEAAFLDLASSGRLRLLFVDDGSTDGTGAVLKRLAAQSADIDTLALPHNVASQKQYGPGWSRRPGGGRR